MTPFSAQPVRAWHSFPAITTQPIRLWLCFQVFSAQLNRGHRYFPSLEDNQSEHGATSSFWARSVALLPIHYYPSSERHPLLPGQRETRMSALLCPIAKVSSSILGGRQGPAGQPLELCAGGKEARITATGRGSGPEQCSQARLHSLQSGHTEKAYPAEA